MTEKQPEALRLADTVLKLRSHLGPWRDESDPDEQAAWDSYTEAADELRRLHALCDEMGEALGNAHSELKSLACAPDSAYAKPDRECIHEIEVALSKRKESK